MCRNSYRNIMIINQIKQLPQMLSRSLWWELPCLSPNYLPFGSDFMVRRCQGQFATRILSLFFFQYSFMRRHAISVARFPHSLLFECANVPFTMICKTVMTITQGA